MFVGADVWVFVLGLLSIFAHLCMIVSIDERASEVQVAFAVESFGNTSIKRK